MYLGMYTLRGDNVSGLRDGFVLETITWLLMIMFGVSSALLYWSRESVRDRQLKTNSIMRIMGVSPTIYWGTMLASNALLSVAVVVAFFWMSYSFNATVVVGSATPVFAVAFVLFISSFLTFCCKCYSAVLFFQGVTCIL
jgi:hypothetical protein